MSGSIQYNDKKEIIKANNDYLEWKEANGAMALDDEELKKQVLALGSRLREEIYAYVPGVKLTPSHRDRLVANLGRSYEAPSKRYLVAEDFSNGAEEPPVPVFADGTSIKPPIETDQPYVYSRKNIDITKLKKLEDDEMIGKVVGPRVCCTCEDGCSSDDCKCRQRNKLLGDASYEGGKMRIPGNLEETVYLSCSRLCRCHETGCSRGIIESPLPHRPLKFELFKKKQGKNYRLRTLCNIEEGEIVLELIGEVINDEEVINRGSYFLSSDLFHFGEKNMKYYDEPSYVKVTNALRYGKEDPTEEDKEESQSENQSEENDWPELYLDCTEVCNIARFANHGCFSNVVIVRTISSEDMRPANLRILYVACQPIIAGSEILVDFGGKYRAKTKKKCICGTIMCIAQEHSGVWKNPVNNEADQMEEVMLDRRLGQIAAQNAINAESQNVANDGDVHDEEGEIDEENDEFGEEELGEVVGQNDVLMEDAKGDDDDDEEEEEALEIANDEDVDDEEGEEDQEENEDFGEEFDVAPIVGHNDVLIEYADEDEEEEGEALEITTEEDAGFEEGEAYQEEENYEEIAADAGNYEDEDDDDDFDAAAYEEEQEKRRQNEEDELRQIIEKTKERENQREKQKIMEEKKLRLEQLTKKIKAKVETKESQENRLLGRTSPPHYDVLSELVAQQNNILLEEVSEPGSVEEDETGLEDEDTRLEKTERRKRTASEIETEREDKRIKLDDLLSKERQNWEATLRPEVEKYALAELHSEAAVSIALCNVNSTEEKLRKIGQRIDRLRYGDEPESEESLSELQEQKRASKDELAACIKEYENQKTLKSCLEAEHEQKGEEVPGWIKELKQDKEFLYETESSEGFEDTLDIKLEAAERKVADKKRHLRFVASEIKTLLEQLKQKEKSTEIKTLLKQLKQKEGELEFQKEEIKEAENEMNGLRKLQNQRRNRFVSEADQPSTSKAVNRVQERSDHNQQPRRIETLESNAAADSSDNTPSNRNNRERCGTPRPTRSSSRRYFD